MAQRPNPPGFRYDPRTRRYQTSDGHWLAPPALIAAIDQVIQSQTIVVRTLTERLVNGQISLADWQSQMAALLKRLHIAVCLASNGGQANTSQADLAFMALGIQEQFSFLLNFSLEIHTGKQILDGTVIARATQYSHAGRTLYADVQARNAHNANMREERNVLGPADHCEGPEGCLAQTKRGWVSIGSLVPIGDRPCRVYCHCHMEYR